MSQPVDGATIEQASAVSMAQLRRALRSRWLLAGVATTVVVFVLRHEGYLSGWRAIVLALGCVVAAPGPRRLAERYLLFFAGVVGILPLLGWIPALETKV